MKITLLTSITVSLLVFSANLSAQEVKVIDSEEIKSSEVSALSMRSGSESLNTSGIVSEKRSQMRGKDDLRFANAPNSYNFAPESAFDKSRIMRLGFTGRVQYHFDYPVYR